MPEGARLAVPSAPRSLHRFCGFLLALLMWGPGLALAVDPSGDYGDAPDCPATATGFPTRFDTDHSRAFDPGVHHLTVGLEKLRILVSAEAGATDPADPDGDPNLDGFCPAQVPDKDGGDDGVRFAPGRAFLHPFATTPYAAWSAAVVVTIDASAPGGKRYLNALVDSNADGRWQNVGGVEEWVVTNIPVTVTPGTSETFLLGLGAHPYGLGERWVRITLTREPIPLNPYADLAGWDGSGVFDYGETEDYLVDAGCPVDPGCSVTPAYNLDIDLPEPCAYFFRLECIPEGSGSTKTWTMRSHCPNPPTILELGYKFTASAMEEGCYVDLIRHREDPIAPGGQGLFPCRRFQNANIGGPNSVPLPGPGDRWDLDSDGTELVVDTIVSLSYACHQPPLKTDPRAPCESLRVKGTFALTCCGKSQAMLQKSCAGGVWHRLGAGGSVLGGSAIFGPGVGGGSPPGTGFGFDYISPTYGGEVRVERVLEDAPHVLPHAQVLDRWWNVNGSIVYPLGVIPSDVVFTEFRFDFTDQDMLDVHIDPTVANKLSLVVRRLAIANFGDKVWSADVGTVSINPVTNRVTVTDPQNWGAYAIGLPQAFVFPITPSMAPLGQLAVAAMLAAAGVLLLVSRRRSRG